MGILQGEALMNDASGLVSLKFAVAVAMGTMVFTVGGATLEFVKVALGGILAGFVVSWLYGRSLRFLSRWGVMNLPRKSFCCSCCRSPRT
jgi:CPA1 family monovalent cation:H+ antiporter